MTVAEVQTRTLQRLDESASAPVRYDTSEVLAAINEGHRFFALLTLCLEVTGAAFVLTAGTATYHVLATYTNWLVPLRLRVGGAGGAKLEPGRLAEFDARNPSWQAEAGTPQRYAHLGFDFLAIHPRPAGSGVSLDLAYARSPVVLTSASTPEIPAEDHPALIDYAIPRLRAKEGGAEFSAALAHFDRFLDAAAKRADYVRARNRAQGYDRGPFEVRGFDRSALVNGMVKRARKSNG